MAIFASRPVEWFKTSRQVREVKEDADLRLLGESLKERQHQPIVARTDGTVIAGHRRLLAAILVGKPTLDVIITDEDLSDSQIKQIQFGENIHRKDMSGYEKWVACVELLGMNSGWQLRDLAGYIHLDPSSCTRLMSPSKCIGEVQDALKDGKIGISDCYAISRLPEGDQAGLLALKLSGATRDQLENSVRKKRNGTPAVRVSRIKCPLPSGSVVQVSGAELSLDDMISAIVELLKEMKRASEQGLDAKTFQSVMRDKAKAR